MSHTIEVNIQHEKTYPVCTGIDLWKEVRAFCSRNYSVRKVCVLIDSKVNALHGEKVRSNLSGCFEECLVIEIPEGEQSKSITEWSRLTDNLLKEGVERGTPIIAVGGGVTGDLAGFVAASVLRGLPLIHLPTSLLAMVDSSIGGKTGVNHDTGKNLIGAFCQPDAVFADVSFLQTLDEKEWINGLAEIIKYAAIRDPDMFDRIQQLVCDGFKPTPEWVSLIADSAKVKIDIVQEDVLEAGKRAFLNFGHTFGHALEKSAGFGAISHGEAVFIGMLAAGYASKKNGAPINYARFDPFVPLYNIDLPDSVTDPEKLIRLMKRDKKVKDETIRLVLLEDWGEPVVLPNENPKLLDEAWSFALRKVKQIS